MSDCPVCQNHHQQEVSKCQRCDWSMEEDVNSIEISLEHPILKTCIPKLIKSLEKEKKEKNDLHSLIQTSNLDIQKENNRKLDKIQEEIEKDREKTDKHFSNLEAILNELKSLLKNTNNSYTNLSELNDTSEHIVIKNNNSELSTSTNSEPDNTVNSLNIIKVDNHDNVHVRESDFQSDNNHNDLSALQENALCYETEQSEFSQTIDIQIPHFVETYNRDKNSFNEFIISTVIETEESRDNRLAGRSEEVFLSNTSKGKYWIVEENNNFYLVPHAKISINEHNKRYTIDNLFECDESSSGDYNFKLIRPAKVSKVNSELWQLEKKGKLDFF